MCSGVLTDRTSMIHQPGRADGGLDRTRPLKEAASRWGRSRTLRGTLRVSALRAVSERCYSECLPPVQVLVAAKNDQCDFLDCDLHGLQLKVGERFEHSTGGAIGIDISDSEAASRA